MSYCINSKPGKCEKCKGAGVYAWGTIVNGKPSHTGRCFACRGKGKQDWSDIARNRTAANYGMARAC